jgi:hypothetical protein
MSQKEERMYKKSYPQKEEGYTHQLKQKYIQPSQTLQE